MSASKHGEGKGAGMDWANAQKPASGYGVDPPSNLPPRADGRLYWTTSSQTDPDSYKATWPFYSFAYNVTSAQLCDESWIPPFGCYLDDSVAYLVTLSSRSGNWRGKAYALNFDANGRWRIKDYMEGIPPVVILYKPIYRGVYKVHGAYLLVFRRGLIAGGEETAVRVRGKPTDHDALHQKDDNMIVRAEWTFGKEAAQRPPPKYLEASPTQGLVIGFRLVSVSQQQTLTQAECFGGHDGVHIDRLQTLFDSKKWTGLKCIDNALAQDLQISFSAAKVRGDLESVQRTPDGNAYARSHQFTFHYGGQTFQAHHPLTKVTASQFQSGSISAHSNTTTLPASGLQAATGFTAINTLLPFPMLPPADGVAIPNSTLTGVSSISDEPWKAHLGNAILDPLRSAIEPQKKHREIFAITQKNLNALTQQDQTIKNLITKANEDVEKAKAAVEQKEKELAEAKTNVVNREETVAELRAALQSNKVINDDTDKLRRQVVDSQPLIHGNTTYNEIQNSISPDYPEICGEVNELRLQAMDYHQSMLIDGNPPTTEQQGQAEEQTETNGDEMDMDDNGGGQKGLAVDDMEEEPSYNDIIPIC